MSIKSTLQSLTKSGRQKQLDQYMEDESVIDEYNYLMHLQKLEEAKKAMVALSQSLMTQSQVHALITENAIALMDTPIEEAAPVSTRSEKENTQRANNRLVSFLTDGPSLMG